MFLGGEVYMQNLKYAVSVVNQLFKENTLAL